MERSDSIKELAAALAKAHAEIEGAEKDATNPHFRSKYATLSSVVEAIKKPLAKTGLSYVQVIHDATNAACVETVILHASGEWIACGKVSVPVSKGDAQGYGSALTYARRYSLSSAFGVAPEDDDGNAASAAKPNTASQVAADEYERLDADMRAWVDEIVGNVASALFRGDISGAVAELETKEIDGDTKLAIWSRLDSKQRAAIKKHQSDHKAKEPA